VDNLVKGRGTYGKKVGALFALVTNLLFRREPEKLGHLLVFFRVLVEVADDADPCLVALCLEQHGVSHFALEAAHARTDDALCLGLGCGRSLPLPWRGSLLRLRIVDAILVVDPFPGVVFVAKLVVGVFAEYSAASEILSCLFYAGALEGSHAERWWWQFGFFVADVGHAGVESTTRRERLGAARAERAMISPLGSLSSRSHDMPTITIVQSRTCRIHRIVPQWFARQNGVEWIRIFIAIQSNHRLALALGLRIIASFIPVMTKLSL
jgi:hypothetical protein